MTAAAVGAPSRAPSPRPAAGSGESLINVARRSRRSIYLFLPIFVIVAFSFNQPKGQFNAVWQQFTFDNWLHPFADKALVDALMLSLEIALIAAVDRHGPRHVHGDRARALPVPRWRAA